MRTAELLDSELFLSICYGAIAMAITLGILALWSPSLFERLCRACRHWVDTPVRLKKIDDDIVDTDALALKHVRLTGLIFISLAIAFAFTIGIL